ncbi:hypothetical protein [Cytobacillus purgationiresistens]|uniref:Lipoprotein n=1 Tax=Cytobacillus purgationiresistens TaxID=863449 RepID=A0ABU0AC70_9BACI|nr:hypothetical protein [Cytobacillus purgationiresistens]MDQ0268854.1 hypothetical protein [Cytobacillus purgationiresistens]
MKKIILLICLLFLAGCSNIETSGEEVDELEIFVSSYNKAAKTLEENSNLLINQLNPSNFQEIERTKDGYGFKRILDNSISDETTTMFTLEVFYDNDKNIIGYQVYSVGNLKKIINDGTTEYSTPGIASSYAIADVLFDDVKQFSDHFLNIMNSEEEEFYYEENGYKVSMTFKADIGAIAIKFMKTE